MSIDKLKILITGGNGYIATSIFNQLKNVYDITKVNRQSFDITNFIETKNWFKDKYFDIIIHTAISGGSRLKQDDYSILDNNLKMYFNLIENKDHFEKFINLGSGAEIYDKNSPYGLSKLVINQSILNKNNFFNLRIFGVFDKNELSTRFIKNNINNYINKNELIIHYNKKMDFIYMDDFITIVKHYINNETCPKSLNCVYQEKFNLIDIANIINNLNSYKCKIKLENLDKISDYIGDGDLLEKLNLNLIGFKKAINITYSSLLNE